MSDSKKTVLIKSNATYDLLKQFAMVTLPALGTLYFALSQIWGLPDAAQVIGSITAFDTFLGVVLHISNVQYKNDDDRYDGHIKVSEEGTATLSLDSDAIQSKDEVAIKIHKPA